MRSAELMSDLVRQRAQTPAIATRSQHAGHSASLIWPEVVKSIVVVADSIQVCLRSIACRKHVTDIIVVNAYLVAKQAPRLAGDCECIGVSEWIRFLPIDHTCSRVHQHESN